MYTYDFSLLESIRVLYEAQCVLQTAQKSIAVKTEVEKVSPKCTRHFALADVFFDSLKHCSICCVQPRRGAANTCFSGLTMPTNKTHCSRPKKNFWPNDPRFRLQLCFASFKPTNIPTTPYAKQWKTTMMKQTYFVCPSDNHRLRQFLVTVLIQWHYSGVIRGDFFKTSLEGPYCVSCLGADYRACFGFRKFCKNQFCRCQ